MRKMDVQANEVGRPERGASAVGTTIALVVLVLLGLFAYRTWTYVSLIRSGEMIGLPQYRMAFTTASGELAVATATVDRALVEAAGNPELGLGAGDHPQLTIVQFADFECPFSAMAHGSVRRLMTRYGDRVRFIYRDYPIADVHPNARVASIAAECAREQGEFWQYHDKLYNNQSALGFADLLRYGAEIGMDMTQFEVCLIDERYAARVDEDTAVARSLGLHGTPTFFFDGQRVEGAIPEEVLERIIVDLLR